VTAPIASVTVLEDRAAVTRRGSAVVTAGQHRLVIERVSPVLVDKTLTATAVGARVLDVRCERYLAPWRDPAAGSIEFPAVLNDERRRLEAVLDTVLAQLAVARSDLAALTELSTAAQRELAISAGRAISSPTAAAQLAALDEASAGARTRQVTAEFAVQDLRAALGRLEHRIALAEASAGQHAADLVIDVLTDAPAEIELAIDYVVPGAAWRPYHRAVLVRAPDSATPRQSGSQREGQSGSRIESHSGGPIEGQRKAPLESQNGGQITGPLRGQIDWQTTACVWQSTGEDWTAAALVFSLDRPSLGTAPPVLVDDELSAQRRPDSVAVEARDHEHHTTGLGGAPDGPGQVPGIDDGGLGIVLRAPRATIASSGEPHRVLVSRFRVDAELDLVAVPLRSSWVHLRARLGNPRGAAAPLLAGPVDLIMASGYVGRSEIGFVAPGEQFALGFGPEADVRVHRSETRERDDAGLLGGWNVQTVRIAVRLSNLGTQPRQVVVTERVPISEVDQVEVQTSPPEAYRLGLDDQPRGEDVIQVMARTIDDRGLVSWSVELPPLGRRAVGLEYKIRSQRGVAGV
jgi:hypothetical protein